MKDRESADPDYVQSFVRGLDVIRAFSRFRPRMTLSEVAEETQMTRAAARRFLLTLVKENYAQSDGKYFELRPKVLDLGFAYLASMTLWDIAEPAELAYRIGCEACAAVFRAGRLVRGAP